MSDIRPPVRVTGHPCGTVLAVLAATALAQAPIHAQAPAQASSSSAPTAASATASKPPRTARRAPLDLHAPPLSHIYSSTQLRYIMTPDDDDDTATEVSVKGAKYVSPVPGAPGNQLLAIPWALMHPTQAWRIFTPLEEP